MDHTYDYILAGAGIIGLSVAREIKKRDPSASILIFDKEGDIARHASGRNSGVLHAGFYYTADSLKARFTVAGNRRLRDFCRQNNLKINPCGKLVVAANASQEKQLYELERRGKANGSNIRIIDAAEALDIEPNARTYKKALYSPDTATIDPIEVCQTIRRQLADNGVDFVFKARFRGRRGNAILTTQGDYTCGRFINCAGLYADIIAHSFGFGQRYTMIPFKGLYLKYIKNKTDVRTNIYPVPNLKNPFLGVHFTKTVDGTIKIGPTATPAFWREHYDGLANFRIGEFFSTTLHYARLFYTNAFDFRSLALEEIRKYNKQYFIALAMGMVRNVDPKGFGDYTAPGIRAQLMDTRTLKLVQDFVVEGDGFSTHVLNAVSPAFTCSFAFAEYVVNQHILTGT